MIRANLEYVPLRLIRRFLFPGALLDKLGHFIPYWRVNQGRLDPAPIVDAYQRLLRAGGIDLLDGKRRAVVELGCGAANGTGYEWAARFGGKWTGVEPFAPLDPGLDTKLFERVHMCYPHVIFENVQRIKTLAELTDASVDCIVSNSVLEHVTDPLSLFMECYRVLTPDGIMLHRVDYRDHFFKYPFQFLTFPQKVWDNLLNPGDLPRHRLDDHLQALTRAGFHVEVLEYERDTDGFSAVAPFLAPPFAGRNPDMLAVTSAALFCRNRR